MKMMMWVFCTVLVVKLFISVDQVKEYREWVDRLAWSVDTLKLNVQAERELMWHWKACAKYHWCYGLPPYTHWIPLRTEEWEFRG